MISLSAHACRVLGVLVEKAHTTPGQYPLTLNAIGTGCNQKSNRHPVTCLEETDVLAALDELRGRQLAREVMLSGSRVAKYRHNAREALGVGTRELVVLTELMLRGPQTLGELRSHASRMHPLESLDLVQRILDELMAHDPPFVRRLAPVPGSRSERFAQILCPDLPEQAAASVDEPRSGDDLAPRIARLERDVSELRSMIEALQAAVPGAPTDA